MHLQIKKLSNQDINLFVELIRVFEDVFEMKDFSIPDKAHLQKVLSKPNFIVVIALLDNQVVGGLTTHILDQYYAKKQLAYVYDLAVKTKLQRQGIGKKLMAEMVKYATAMGCEEVFVQADKVDDYALDFYRSTPITAEEDVIHFYYHLND